MILRWLLSIIENINLELKENPELAKELQNGN